ncbi:uncharacterized protein LOC131604931 [Vicia villosa]|uniref:uncharacterized protein LOC131604931 n=1 Tax=Vicia villosa TaxID=3911 RepID=UPI00273C965A|nr:uncharacterized protein LOC131604931 [Vicia villosa]
MAHQIFNDVAIFDLNDMIWLTVLPNSTYYQPNILQHQHAVFGWKCIRDRIATREQLNKRGVLSNSIPNECALCNGGGESVLHLLVLCPFASAVWQQVCAWADIAFYQAVSLVEHMMLFYASVERRVPAKKRLLLWLAVIWAIWCRRNAVIFKNEEAVVAEVFEQIRLSSWHWQIIGESKGSN